MSQIDKPQSIEELQKILEREHSWTEDDLITILPNGEIRAGRVGVKPLTMKENLGGEYAFK